MSRGKRSEENVDVPITPMLDMAFQLLTFFILTYHPMPAEGQFVMNLMPESPAASIFDKAETPNDATPNPDIPAMLKTLPTTLRAGEGGQLGQVTIGENEVRGMAAMKKELETILKDPTLPFNQALIKVDPNLKYSELMSVINIFSDLKVTKISFAELTDEGSGQQSGPSR